MTVTFSVVALFMVGCRAESVVPEGGEQDVSIAYLKTLYSGAPTKITSDIRITGAVISSDRDGNFHHTLVVDDGSTGGIEIKLGIDEIFKRFMIHTHVSIRTQGLWLGSYGGTLQLGDEPFDEYETQPLSDPLISEHLFVDNEFQGEVLPRRVRIAELSPRDISTFVALDGVRFAGAEQGLTWAETETGDGSSDGFVGGFGDGFGGYSGYENGVNDGEIPSATNRYLVDSEGDMLAVRTSRYARFASWQLPAGVGRIEGVLGYFGGEYQLVVTDAMAFEQQ